MRKLVFLLMIFISPACKESRNKKTVAPNQITKKEVHHTISVWATAMLDNQLGPQEKILDDTWLYSGSDDGLITTKKKALARFKPGETSLKEIILKDTIVRLYGNVAILTGREELVFVENNDTSSVQLRFTDVFLKENDSVTAISTHSSPIKNLHPEIGTK